MGRISVVTNACIIAFTSEFIPRLVYKYRYSPDTTLNGYLNFTLSYFDPKDFENQNHEDSNMLTPENIIHPKYCRYRDFRYPPWETEDKIYKETDVFWHVLAARLAFVVVFQNGVALVVMAIKWIVPNIHSDIEDRCRREAYVTNEVIIRSELLKAKGVIELDDGIGELAQHENREDFLINQEAVIKPKENRSNTMEAEVTLRNRKLSSGDRITGDVTDVNIVV